MKILYLGDVMGRAGRNAIRDRLPGLRDKLKLDFVVVNGENATSGVGLSPDHSKLLFEAGADVVTLGDHAFDQKDMLSYIEKDRSHARAQGAGRAGAGAGLHEAPLRRSVFCN